MFEPLVAEPRCDVKRPLSVMTENDQPLIGIEFLVGARRDIAHGHVHAAVDVCGREFPRFAHVDESDFFVLEKSRRLGGGNLVIQHGTSLCLVRPEVGI